MSAGGCTFSYQDLVERTLAGTLEGNEHFATCGRCLERLAGIREELATVRRDRPLPVAEATVRVDVARAIALAELKQASEAGRFRQGALRLALSAAGLVLLVGVGVTVWSRDGRPTQLVAGALSVQGQRLAAGAAPPADAWLVVTEPAALELSDGTRIRLTEGTRAKLRPTSDSIWLEEGMLSLVVRPRPSHPLVIETAEAVTTVVGTRFTVERTPGPTPRTKVEVSEGVVEVRAGDQVERLAAGRSWASGLGLVEPETAPRDPSVAKPAEPTAPPGATVRPEVQREPPTHRSERPRTSEIRQRLRDGKVAEARALLRRLGSTGGSAETSDEAAELAILEAETRLQEGSGREALVAYLEVVERFPRKPQAEEALFAASQLTLDYRSKRDGAALLERYLATYPGGKFVSEAHALLRGLRGEQ